MPSRPSSAYTGVWQSAIVHNRVGIGSFTKEALGDARVRRMSGMVSARPDPDLPKGRGFTPPVVEIRTRGGGVYSKLGDYLLGVPDNPMSFADIETKFKRCCEYAVTPIPEENQERVIEMVRGIERLSDVGSIVPLL